MSFPPPSNCKFTADGQHLAYLHSKDGTAQQLHCMRLSDRSVKVAVRPMEDKKEYSLAEQLRRERQRQMLVGISEYFLSPNPKLPYVVIPQAGNLFVQDGFEGELRLLFDAEGSTTPTNGPAIAPQISPNGQLVAFVQDNEVFVIPLDGSAPAEQVTSGAREASKTNGVADFIAQEEMDRYDGFWWSPDSASIAFEQVDESHIPVYRIMHQGKDALGDSAQEDHRYPFAGADNPKVTLGVVSLASKAVTWMNLGDGPLRPAAAGREDDPTDNYLARVHWLPTGQLAVQLQNREQTVMDLLRLDPTTGESSLILTETNDVWINLHHVFHPFTTTSPDGTVRFLWASERSGYNHIYLYDLPPTGPATLVRQVTGGQFVVRSLAAVDESAGVVYFHSNLGSPLYHHLCRVPVAGPTDADATATWRTPESPGYVKDHTGVSMDESVAAVTDFAWAGDDHQEDILKYGIQRLTTAPGSHTATVDGTFGHVVDLFHSSASNPSLTLYKLTDEHALFPESPAVVHVLHEAAPVPSPSSAGADAGAGAGAGAEASDASSADAKPPVPFSYDAPKSAPEFVAFATADRKEVMYGALYLPDATRHGDGPYPTAISVYGGPGVALVTDSYRLLMNPRSQNLRDQGFAVFMVDNRGSLHRGKRFEAPIKHHMGTVEVDDQVEGVQYLVRRGICDASRVGIYGWSYGGYMTCMALARRPDVFHVGVSGAPVTSWDGYDTHYTERYMWTPKGNAEGYADSAVMTHAEAITGKLMLVHGLIDENVHFRHTARLINALITHRIPYDLLLFPEERHSPRRAADRRYMEERIAQYFVENLKGRSVAAL